MQQSRRQEEVRVADRNAALIISFPTTPLPIRSLEESTLASVGSEAVSQLNRALLGGSHALPDRNASTHAHMRRALVLAELQG